MRQLAFCASWARSANCPQKFGPLGWLDHVMIAARFEGLFAGRLAGVPGNADQDGMAHVGKLAEILGQIGAVTSRHAEVEQYDGWRLCLRHLYRAR